MTTQELTIMIAAAEAVHEREDLARVLATLQPLSVAETRVVLAELLTYYDQHDQPMAEVYELATGIRAGMSQAFAQGGATVGKA